MVCVNEIKNYFGHGRMFGGVCAHQVPVQICQEQFQPTQSNHKYLVCSAEFWCGVEYLVLVDSMLFLKPLKALCCVHSSVTVVLVKVVIHV